LGRRTEAEQAISEAGKLLQRMPNRQLLCELKISRAGMAYQDGRMNDARNLLGDILRDPPAEKQAAANLLAALVRIRTRADREEEFTTALLEPIDRDGLPFDGASARLAIAEALAAGNRPSVKARDAALSLALKALEFLESRNITESVWRAHAVAAWASTEPAKAEVHRADARGALARLSTLWTLAGMTAYLKRPDIAALAARLK
jgi:hypothetical protein